MRLFSDKLVEDTRRLPGAQHSFLHQLCTPQAGRHRRALEAMLEDLDPALAEACGSALMSLDNRRFFQGYSELMVARLMARGRLRVRERVQPGGYLRAQSLAGGSLHIAVLSFIHKAREAPDQATVRRLVAALNRVGSRRRLVVVVHDRLPHDFDAEEVRRAVDAWLGEVERGAWQGRFATFVDEKRGIDLEFGIAGKSSRRGSRVCMVIGPFRSPGNLAAVQPRVLGELNRYLLGPQSGQPLLLVCAGDQPWRIPPGVLRDYLYGMPARIESYSDGDSSAIELAFRRDGVATLFSDPVYADLCGILWVGRSGGDPATVHAVAQLNPWARQPLDPELLPPIPTLAQDRVADGQVILRWRGDRKRPELALL